MKRVEVHRWWPSCCPSVSVAYIGLDTQPHPAVTTEMSDAITHRPTGRRSPEPGIRAGLAEYGSRYEGRGCSNSKLEARRHPDARAGSGQLLLTVERCGICGSDLHARVHCDELADLAAATGYDHFMRSDQRVRTGHEFCGEIADYGPAAAALAARHPGGRVLPILRLDRRRSSTGLSAVAPGGYAGAGRRSGIDDFPVPNGLSANMPPSPSPWPWPGTRCARRDRREAGRLVIGCGPIGLAVIAMLKAAGARTVVASDFSPRAASSPPRCGADAVVDPAIEEPWTAGPARRSRPASPTS